MRAGNGHEQVSKVITGEKNVLGGELMATTDIDFLWDARQRFTFLMQDINERGVMALLRQVDSTFTRRCVRRLMRMRRRKGRF